MNYTFASATILLRVILFLIALRMIFPPPNSEAPDMLGEPLIVPLAIPAIAGQLAGA